MVAGRVIAGAATVVTPLPVPFVAGSVQVNELHDVFAVVADDEGHTGLGYATAFFPDHAEWLHTSLAAACRSLGQRPLADWEALSSLADAGYLADDVGVATLNETAVGALQLAALELAALRDGQSVQHFLHGEMAGHPLYVSGGALNATDEDLQDQFATAAALGAGAIKVKISGREPTEAATRARRVIDSAPAALAVALDANQTFAPTHVTPFVAALGAAAERVAWLEEPVDAHDLDGLEQVRRQVPVPLAAGETLFGARSVARLTDGERCQVLILNPARVGGPASFLALGDKAAAAGMQVASHVNAHLAAHLMPPRWPRRWIEYLSWWDHHFDRDAHRIAQGRLAPTAHVPGFGFDADLRTRLGRAITTGSGHGSNML